MALFEGTNPPAWLQERAETNLKTSIGATRDLGSLLGSGLAAAVNWATENPGAKVPITDPVTGQVTQGESASPLTGTTGRQSFWTHFQEARLNQENPLWAMKAQQERQGILSKAAEMKQNEETYRWKADEQHKWMGVLGNVGNWLRDPDRASKPVPDTGGSVQALEAVTNAQQQDRVNALNKKSKELQLMQAEARIDAIEAKIKQDQERGDELTRHRVELEKQGAELKQSQEERNQAVAALDKARTEGTATEQTLSDGTHITFRPGFGWTKVEHGDGSVDHLSPDQMIKVYQAAEKSDNHELMESVGAALGSLVPGYKATAPKGTEKAGGASDVKIKSIHLKDESSKVPARIDVPGLKSPEEAAKPEQEKKARDARMEKMLGARSAFVKLRGFVEHVDPDMTTAEYRGYYEELQAELSQLTPEERREALDINWKKTEMPERGFKWPPFEP